MLGKRRKWRRSGEEAGGQGSRGGEEVREALYINKFTERIKCESTDGNYKVSSLCESSLFKKKKKTQAIQHRVTQEECGTKKDRSLSPCGFSAVRLCGCHSTFPSSRSFICKAKIITGPDEIFQRAVLSRPP